MWVATKLLNIATMNCLIFKTDLVEVKNLHSSLPVAYVATFEELKVARGIYNTNMGYEDKNCNECRDSISEHNYSIHVVSSLEASM